MIALEGNIKTGRYEKEGITFYTSDVWVDSVSFTGEPQNGSQSGGNNQGYNNTIVQPETPQGAGQTAYSDFEDVISDEGVPF
jgi:single-strand DNA-binding protein